MRGQLSPGQALRMLHQCFLPPVDSRQRPLLELIHCLGVDPALNRLANPELIHASKCIRKLDLEVVPAIQICL